MLGMVTARKQCLWNFNRKQYLLQSRKCIPTCRLQSGDHFVSASNTVTEAIMIYHELGPMAFMRRHYQRKILRYQLENENLKCILKITSRCPREQWVKEQSCGGLWPIAVGDTKWDCVIKIWGIHSHEWHYQPQGTCSYTDLYKNLNIWHLVNQIHPETPWQFGVLCVQCKFSYCRLFLFTHKILDENNFDDFDMWQNVDVQVLIERILLYLFTVSLITFPISVGYDSSSM